MNTEKIYEENNEQMKKILKREGFRLVHERERMTVDKYHFNLLNVVLLLGQQKLENLKGHQGLLRIDGLLIICQAITGALVIGILVYLIFFQ